MNANSSLGLGESDWNYGTTETYNDPINYRSPSFYDSPDFRWDLVNPAYVQWHLIPTERIAAVPSSMLEITQLRGPQLSGVTQVQWTAKGFDVNQLEGNLDGASIVGNILTLSDGSTFDLRSGRAINVDSTDTGIDFSDGMIDIIGGEEITHTAERIQAARAQEFRSNGATAQQLLRLDANIQTFSFASADLVTTDTGVLRDLGQSTFSVENGFLRAATVTSAKEENTVLLRNPIAGSSPFIQISFDAEERFRIEIENKVTIIPIDQVEIAFGDRAAEGFTERITFAPTETDATLELFPDLWPIYRIAHGQLNYTSANFIEILDSHCRSEVNIHYDFGFMKVLLEPVVQLCAGGRYSYLDQRKERSWSLLNIGEEIFDLGLNKNELLSEGSFLASLSNDLSHGFSDFPLSLELWGKIQYERLRAYAPELESRATYETLHLPFQLVHQNHAPHGHALLHLDSGESVDLRLDNAENDPTISTYTVSNSGMHRISEQFIGTVSRFFDFNKQPVQPIFVRRYRSTFGREKPVITFQDHTLDLRCPSAQNVTLYSEYSGSGKRFADDLSYLAGITFDAYVKKYGGGAAVVGKISG